MVNILRNSDADVIIEIGCGMGDIISRVEISQRGIGIDLDQQIINCAKYLHGSKCSFYNADLVSSPELLSNLTSEKDKNMLVMINWLHNIEFSLLEKVVTELKRKANINYLLMDVIHENTKGYKYKHSQASSLGDVLLTEESIDKVRYFILIKLSG